MTLLDLLKSDIVAATTAVTSSVIGNLTPDIALQRLAWTLAILVSLFTIIKHLYRFWKWCREPFNFNFDDNDAKDED